MRDISRATRKSLAGLYYYFATKEELLYLIQERCFLTLLQRWEQAASAHKDAHARIRAFAENHLSFFLHNMHEMKVMAHEDESLSGEFQDKILARGHLRALRYDELDLHLVPTEARLAVLAVDRANAAVVLFWTHQRREG